MNRWTLDLIAWDKIDHSKVTPQLRRLAKAASLVEYNSQDYVQYLLGVFPNDKLLEPAIWKWGREERQHGEALRKWVECVDPSFDFETSLKKFKALFRIPIEATTSIRGSQAKELLARCMVETGTSSYYTALADFSNEPVLSSICRYIALDEIHHYNLFFSNYERYAAKEKLTRWDRIKTLWTRLKEAEDEELTCAYFAANYIDTPNGQFDFKRYNLEYGTLGYNLYQPKHVSKAVKLALKAGGFDPNSRLSRGFSLFAYHLLKWRQGQYEKQWMRIKDSGPPTAQVSSRPRRAPELPSSEART